MIKSSCLLLAVVLLTAPTFSTEQWEENDYSSSCEGPNNNPLIESRKRTNEVLDETPPSTPPGQEGVVPFEGALKSRRILVLGEKEDVVSFKLKLKDHLNDLCETIFKKRRSAAGRGVKAGEYYRQALGEEGLTDISLINKVRHIFSLQCSLWDCDNNVFSSRMVTLREITQKLESCIEDSAKKNLTYLFVLIEKSLFRKGCMDSIDRPSLNTLCDDLSLSLGNASPDAIEEVGPLRNNLVKSGQHIMEICDGLQRALRPDEVVAVQQLKTVLEQATGSSFIK